MLSQITNNQLTSNEIITISISIAALIVSLVTLYYSVFYKKIALIGTMLSWNRPNPQEDEKKEKRLDVNVEFALSNIGNRELLIKEVEVDWENPPENALVPYIFPEEIPCVLKPSQIKLIEFKVPLFFMKQIKNQNQKLVIRFQTISPNGKTYFLSKHLTPYTDDMEWIAEDWKPFTLSKWNLKSLFSRK
jgi:hypothetical protein